MTARITVRLLTYAGAAVRMLLAPQAALMNLRERPTFWFPLAAVVLGTALSSVLYFCRVDFEWLLQEQAHSLGGGSSSQFTSRTAATLVTLSATAVGIPVLRVIQALYFQLAGRLLSIKLTFRHWFSLACWSNLPLLLTLPAFVGALFMYPNGQVLQQTLEILSLNNLLFGFGADDPLFELVSALTVLHPWAWWLAAMGIQLWTGLSLATSVLVVLLPKGIVYGGWAAAILLRTP